MVSHPWLLFAFSGRLEAGRSRRRKLVDYMAVRRELQVQAVCVHVSNQALYSTTCGQPVPVFLLCQVSAFWLLQGDELITMSLTPPTDRLLYVNTCLQLAERMSLQESAAIVSFLSYFIFYGLRALLEVHNWSIFLCSRSLRRIRHGW